MDSDGEELGGGEEIRGHYARELTASEVEKLSEPAMREYLVGKYEKEARKHWDLFYKRNTTNFFKDRHWLAREFPELHDPPKDGESHLRLLEVGCGVGNAAFPLLEENPRMFVYCCDLSPRAVDLVKANEKYDEARIKSFQCDLTADPLTTNVPEASLDLVTALFVLSAISLPQMTNAVKNIYAVLKPGGTVLFRDYGLYDYAQLRFKPGHKLDENFYVRQDGTRAYYFSEEVASKLFEDCGFKTVSICYIQKTTENKKKGLNVPRIFVQARFQKLTCDEIAARDLARVSIHQGAGVQHSEDDKK